VRLFKITRPSISPRPRGVAIIYALFAMVVILGMAVYAIDLGRVVVAQDQLQTAADAAARYAAVGVVTSSSKSTTAYNQAAAVCSDLRVDGRAIALATSDVQVGIWNAQTRTFTQSGANNHTINAVRVTVRQTIGGAGSVRLVSEAIGGTPRTITRTSIATATVIETEVTSPSQGNLWLAGMPNNTHITNLQGNATRYDNSGNNGNRKQRPEEISLTDLGLEAGDVVSFEGLSGVGSNGGGAENTGPDGQTNRPVTLGNANATTVPNNSVNGIANVRAPLAACMAVFLGDSAPTSTSAPACLDFGLQTQRDYLNISPEVKQPFFVGDGKTSWGEVQYIRIPTGATRIFLGMMDAWQWNDNTGNFRLKFYRGQVVTTVE
jgi:Flp pilus assembly protein TadG